MPISQPVATPTDRLHLRAAIADTRVRSDALRDDFRGQRERYVRVSESLAVERRILREALAV